MQLPSDYAERVYAGVLGKIIGVYLGRPFEGWTYDRIMKELGEIWYYVHEQRHVPLIVTDFRAPGSAIETAQASLLDLYPSILDWAGIAPPANADGIVPEDTAVSVLRLAGSTAKDTVVCGDDAVRPDIHSDG